MTAVLALAAFPALTCMLMALARTEESLARQTEPPRPDYVPAAPR